MKWDDFIEAHENDLKEDPDNHDLIVETMRFYFYINHWYGAKELALKLIDLNPESDQGYFFLGYCEYHLGNDRDAYDILDQALEKDPSNMDSYLLQLRLLIRNGVFDTAHDLVNFLYRCGAGKEPVLQWCENWLFFCEKQEVMDNDMRGIISRFYELDEVFQGAMTQDRAEFYYTFALCVHRYESGITDDQVIEILNRGLEANPHDRNCLDFLGWLLKRMGETEKAIVVYETLRSFPNHELGTEVCLLELYDPNMLPYMESVLDCLHAIKRQHGEKNEEFLYYKGRYYYFLGKYDQAIYHFKQLKEIAPEKMGGYRSMGFAYMAQGRYEEALELADGALLLSEGWNNRKRYYVHKAQLYRRLGRPYDAVDVIYAMAAACQEPDVYAYLYDIYAQFGLWDEVEKLLQEWKEYVQDVNGFTLNGKDQGNPGTWALASIKYALAKRDYFTAQALFDQYQEQIDEKELIYIDEILSAWKGDYQHILDIWKEAFQKEEDPDAALVCYYEHHISLAYRILNQEEKSVAHANKGLAAMENGKHAFANEDALYHTKHSALLFLAGEEAAAVKERGLVSKLPLCEHCSCENCKDQKLFELEAAYVKGDYFTGMQLIQEYGQLWPDELDLVFYENLMNVSGGCLS